ncbi:hypothetical protein EVAR_36754_1 [Eumeta japonica]|uniref:Uncharacterized protein n=1 Tax=Eumeta variegata TaxID=151549 RepID=A0A4C1WZZ0_EUMVA|nr:hypothetical protein EVAR_36754_1 [Eumeta japonica]
MFYGLSRVNTAARLRNLLSKFIQCRVYNSSTTCPYFVSSKFLHDNNIKETQFAKIDGESPTSRTPRAACLVNFARDNKTESRTEQPHAAPPSSLEPTTENTLRESLLYQMEESVLDRPAPILEESLFYILMKLGAR